MPQSNQTEQATPRRRQKAREKGQVARSRDLIGACSGMAAIFVLASMLPAFPHAWRILLRDCLDGAAKNTSLLGTASPLLNNFAVFVPVTAALAVAWVVALGSALAQGSLVFAPEALMPAGSRISPVTRVGQLFSVNAVRGLVKSLLPAIAVASFALSSLRRDWPAFLSLSARSSRGVVGFAAGRLFEIGWKAALVLLCWAVLDYMFERQHLSSELKMSRQELADEYKESEGNPVIKARMRRLRRQLRRKKMLDDTKRAAVVITNPTEYAIALEYRSEMPAPILVAKGRNLFAAQIKEIARWEGIPMVENVPLAHTLYRTIEVGQSIPPRLYAVIAEILAVIYRAEARAAAAGGRR